MAAEIVRVTTEEQLSQVLDIGNKVFVEEQKLPQKEEKDEFDSLGPNVYHLLLVEGGIPLASGRLTYLREGTAKLQRIGVLKEHRAKGYGRVLMLALEELARELGLDSTVIDSPCRTEDFYRKLGYQVMSDKPFYEAGVLHIRMQKQL